MDTPYHKRKRAADDRDKPQKKSKKAKISASGSRSNVATAAAATELLRPRIPPVVVSSPGILPQSVEFKHFVKSTTRAKNGEAQKYQELMLHCDDHALIKYTGAEVVDRLQKHYIGLFDPETSQIKLIETRRLEITTTVKAKEATLEEQAMQARPKEYMQAKNNLMQAFGNKRARKAVMDQQINAAPKTETNAEGENILDATSKVVLSLAKERFDAVSTQEALAEAADTVRVAPRHNPHATRVEDVYPPADLIGASVLAALPIERWASAMANDEKLTLPSRFVAHRVKKVATAAASSGDSTPLRVLRYLSYVLAFFHASRPGKMKGTRQIPPRDKLQESMVDAPSAVLESIRLKFSQDGVMHTHHAQLLYTYCCALALVIDDYSTNIIDLEGDLRLPRDEMIQYYRDIGAKVMVEVGNIAEKTLTKSTGKAATRKHVAVLSLPLSFPKVARKKRRERTR